MDNSHSIEAMYPIHSVSSTSENISDNMKQAANVVEPIPSTSQQTEEASPSDHLPKSSNRNTKTKLFHVDTSLIPSAQIIEQESVLESLGLSVFNQEEFEHGVMGQVDQAIAAEEQERLHKILTKELASVSDEIRICKQELSQVDRSLSLVTNTSNNKEIEKRKESLRRHKDNKLKQLKKMKAKQKSLTIKLQGNTEGLDVDDELLSEECSSLEGALGLTEPAAETEQERLIRTGEMTPFGTVMNLSENLQKDSIPADTLGSSKSQLSDFEQYLLDQEGKVRISKAGKRVRKQDSAGKAKKIKHDEQKQCKVENIESKVYGATRNKAEKTDSMNNFFDKKDHRSYNKEKDFSNFKQSRPRYSKLSQNFGSDSERSDYEDGRGSSEDEYVPNEKEWKNSWDSEVDSECDEDQVKIPQKKLKRTKGTRVRSKRPPKYIESDNDELSVKSKLPKSIKCRDDGNAAYYRKRIKQHRKSEALRKQQLIEHGESEESDAEFDGGFTVPGIIWNKLYKYQKTGVRWLWELHCQNVGGIVGDEMGLGKTIQMITFLTGLRKSGLRDRQSKFVGLGPTLIVCPATVMHQWVKEFHTWWPPFRVAILHSSGTFNKSEESLVGEVVHTNGVLVTSFATMLGYQNVVLKHNWHYVILDEGHKIRNPDAQITVACKQLRTCHRIILSGSPVQNNLKELWSLIDFVFPGKLGTLPDFLEHFSVPITQGGYSNASQIQVQTAYKCATILRDMINPYLLRRMKSDVRSTLQLPNKNEQVLFCRLTEYQRDVYKEYLDSRECHAILAGKFMIFPGLITLRKICNHPDLSTGGPKIFCHEYAGTDEVLHYGYWKRSGKMMVVEALLKLWKKQEHKVLLFSQSRQMLDIMESFIQRQGHSYMRMDGTTAIGSRQTMINTFNNDPTIFVFLLTTRVGGLGVNLTGANRIIIFDPDWNPSTDMQARERAWRIGQNRQVTIYRLLTSGTIEEKIYHRQIFKQFLTNRVLKDPKQRRFFKSNDLFELFTLSTEQHEEGTETSAIFAGTGSNVTVQPRLKGQKSPKDTQKRVINRFDLIKSGKRQNEDDGTDDDEFIGSADISPAKVQKTGTESSVDIKTLKMKELARKLSLQIGQGDGTLSDSREEKSKGRQPDDKGSTFGKSKQKKDRKKSKKLKKRKRDAVLEGEKIKYLERHSAFKKADDEEDAEKNAKQDDYVLRKLFKNSGVHSALQHDTIMEASHPDYALVEGEAERVARDAARALKQSRTKCFSPSSGVPTWTGSHGQLASKSQRFGSKKGSSLPTSASKIPPAEKLSDPVAKAKHFDGRVSGTTQTETASTSATELAPGSSQLIANMRTRNYVSKPVNHADDEVEENNTESMHTDLTPEDQELISDIRNFISFQCAVDGQATTHELLNEFGSRLPPADSAKFKAMLKQICYFEKQNSIGIWHLNREFK